MKPAKLDPRPIVTIQTNLAVWKKIRKELLDPSKRVLDPIQEAEEHLEYPAAS